MSTGTVIDRDEVKLQICLAAEGYLEEHDARLEAEAFKQREHARADATISALNDAAQRVARAQEREALALARLRAKVAAW